MPKPFVVPEGVVFLVEDDGVTIENAGDVVLHTDFGGRMLKRIVSTEGSVELHGSVNAGRVAAAESARFLDDATVEELVAGRDISVAGKSQLASVRAGGSLHLAGDATLGTTSVGGDLTVDGALTAGNIEAGGGLVVGGAAALADVTAGGTVSLLGAATAGTLRAAELNLRGATLTARGIQGNRRVAIGPARITVDAVIAPQVDLDPNTSGRVTVIESQNELGPNALKGCFRLADYAGLVGDPDAFLADRGLVPLGEALPAPAPNVPAPEPTPPVDHAPEHEGRDDAPADHDDVPAAEPVPAEAAGGSADEEASSTDPAEEDPDTGGGAVAQVRLESADSMARAAEAAVDEAAVDEAAVDEAAVDEAVDEPAAESAVEMGPGESASDEEVDEVVEYEADPVSEPRAPSAAVVEVESDPESEPAAVVIPQHTGATPTGAQAGEAEHPMHGQLVETVQRIVDCYAGQELPDAVAKLQALIEARAYAQVRGEITNIWSELLKFHRKKGLRIHTQVNATFNSVNSIVKKM